MRINSSVIGMDSARRYTASSGTVRRFSIMDYQQSLAGGSNGLNTAVKGGQENTRDENGTALETDTSQTVADDWQSRYSFSTGLVSIRKSPSEIFSDIREQCIKYIFDLLFTGRNKSELQRTGTNTSTLTDMGQSQSGNGENDGSSITMMPVSNLKVLNYQQASWQKETEETSFSTTGVVKTADGREIQFNMNVGMSREFEQYYEQNLTLAQFQMCDPLVINLDGDVAGLSDQTFYFDIDADGKMDEISQLEAGSGYLALDKNGDGTINDGSELFGTSSGNGFSDLAQYDEDGNGWIDENDAVWNKLKIWCRDENGKDVLYRLADKGVGAICLQNVSTDFALKGQEGRTNGAIRNTGVFLYENGSVGTVQHVDVTKFNQNA